MLLTNCDLMIGPLSFAIDSSRHGTWWSSSSSSDSTSWHLCRSPRSLAFSSRVHPSLPSDNKQTPSPRSGYHHLAPAPKRPNHLLLIARNAQGASNRRSQSSSFARFRLGLGGRACACHPLTHLPHHSPPGLGLGLGLDRVGPGERRGAIVARPPCAEALPCDACCFLVGLLVVEVGCAVPKREGVRPRVSFGVLHVCRLRNISLSRYDCCLVVGCPLRALCLMLVAQLMIEFLDLWQDEVAP
ncbi:hypothetical protein IWX49DRAFT_157504 [Phyllosticta citricarpa]|uniref:Uncharacterized protein n=1 Tax=Phyllosticta citricarpa TaxID=55181 RepID=A0ABR1M9Q2_9PEZI